MANLTFAFSVLAVGAGAGALLNVVPFQGSSVTRQSVTPGTKETGHAHLSGTIIASKIIAGGNLTSSASVITAYSPVANSTGVQAIGLNFGLRGQSQATSGLAYGGYFDTMSDGGYGVWARNRSTTGGAAGLFEALGTGGYGVRGKVMVAGNTGSAIFGENPSPTGYAGLFDGRVYAPSLGLNMAPVAGNALAVGGTVRIEGANVLEFGGGIPKEANAGKIGYATFTPQTLDIVGAGTTGANRMIKFWNEGGATFNGNVAMGTTDVNAARLYAIGLSNGIIGRTSATGYIGVFGSNGGNASSYGMYSYGNMHVDGTLSKAGGAFRIDHPLDPENKYLQHSFVESPDMMNVYNGNVTTDAKGVAWIEMPDWFDVINKDFRYQLTVLDESDEGFALAKVYRPLRDNRFAIKTNGPRVHVSWQITGIRKDPWAQANRIQVEPTKPGKERGTYQNPELYNMPQDRGLSWMLEGKERRVVEPPKPR